MTTKSDREIQGRLADRTFREKELKLVQKIRAQEMLVELGWLPAFQEFLRCRLAADQAVLHSDEKPEADFGLGKAVGRIEILMDLRADIETQESRLKSLNDQIDHLRQSHNQKVTP